VIVNAAYIAVASAILFRCLRSKVMAAATVVILMSFVVPAWMHIPTSGGLRFLPPLLVCFGLILWPQRMAPALIALLVASFYSFDGFLWGALTFFAAVGVRLVYERGDLRKWASTISPCIAVLLLGHLVFASLWRVLFGAFPRYDIYLEIVRYNASYWGDIPFTTPPVWIIFSTTYFVAIALAVAEALRGKIGHDPFLVTTVFPIAIAGIAGFSYWVGRPLEFNLWCTVVPAFILGAMAIDRLLPNIWYGTVMGALAILLSAIYVIQPGWPQLQQRLPRFASVMTTPTDVRAYDAVVLDAARLIEKHRSSITDRIVLFVRQPRAVPIYLLTGTFDAFGRSTDAVAVSTTFMKRFRALVDRIELNTIIFAEPIVADEAAGRRRPDIITDSFTPHDLEAYIVLSSRYKLCVIDKTPLGLIAAQLKEKASTCSYFDQ
jgi:hypothetical protein